MNHSVDALSPDTEDTDGAAAITEPGSIGVAEPRTRWAGIIWGLILAAIATGGIWCLFSDVSATGLTPWVMSLTPFTMGIYVVLAIAAIAVVIALIVLIRYAQKHLARRRARL